jgi:hypothetical protein
VLESRTSRSDAAAAAILSKEMEMNRSEAASKCGAMYSSCHSRGLRSEGTPNPDSTYGVYILKTLSQETIFSNANFLAWSLPNIPLGYSTPALLNKRTHHTCEQPHGIRTGFVLREDLESNLDLVSKFSLLSHH